MAENGRDVAVVAPRSTVRDPPGVVTPWRRVGQRHAGNRTGILLHAAGDTSWDATSRADTDEAFRRTGPDVGAPAV